MFENNIPFPLSEEAEKGVRMVWNDFVIYKEGRYPHVVNRMLPRPCMHCMNAPCVKVCPVAATYKSIDGLTMQRYDICIGCRLCINACPYGVRTFNWFDAGKRLSVFEYTPNPTGQPVRPLGVAEKCIFCVQRLDNLRYDLKEGKVPKILYQRLNASSKQGQRAEETMSKAIDIIMRYHLNNEAVADPQHYSPPLAAYLPACVQTCPAGARVFGDLDDEESLVYELAHSKRAFILLEELGTKPNVIYLKET